MNPLAINFTDVAGPSAYDALVARFILSILVLINLQNMLPLSINKNIVFTNNKVLLPALRCGDALLKIIITPILHG